jgi:hypothetical protein
MNAIVAVDMVNDFVTGKLRNSGPRKSFLASTSCSVGDGTRAGR